jgi:putative restriction endonuclease
MSKTFDDPFYKQLSRNDTGETGGHQGGVVIPQPLAEFFPHLTVAGGPTAEQIIEAELFDEDEFLGTVSTRYQIQTWGKERGGEHRLTRNLRPFLRRATAGDALMFQRQLGEVDRFKLVLLHKGTRAFKKVVQAGKSAAAASHRKPATSTDFEIAEKIMNAALDKAFRPTEPDEVKKWSVVQRRVRTELFQRTVRICYENLCALCGRGMLTPANVPEVEAAHIIPRGENGSNDVRNGLALCRSHHWAFDRLLWTVTEDNEIAVPRKVRRIEQNAKLSGKAGRSLRLPDEEKLHPAPVATEHHRRRTIEVWGKL